jgi:hypothetical protein
LNDTFSEEIGTRAATGSCRSARPRGAGAKPLQDEFDHFAAVKDAACLVEEAARLHGHVSW